MSVFTFENGTDTLDFSVGPAAEPRGCGCQLGSGAGTPLGHTQVAFPTTQRNMTTSQTVRRVDGFPQPSQAMSAYGCCVFSVALHRIFQVDKEFSQLP